MTDPKILIPAHRRLRSRSSIRGTHGAQSGHVRGRDRSATLTTVLIRDAIWSLAPATCGFAFQIIALALVHGALRQLRRSRGRRPRQGQADTLRKTKTDTMAKKLLAATAARVVRGCRVELTQGRSWCWSRPAT